MSYARRPASRRSLQFQAITVVLILTVLISVLTQATSVLSVVLSSAFIVFVLIVLGVTLSRLWRQKS
jgi:hypothetical protein